MCVRSKLATELLFNNQTPVCPIQMQSFVLLRMSLTQEKDKMDVKFYYVNKAITFTSASRQPKIKMSCSSINNCPIQMQSFCSSEDEFDPRKR